MPLLEVENLVKHYPVGDAALRAVDDVSFTIEPGETVGLVGESGCGKTTLGRVIAGLLPTMAGTVRLDGHVVSGLSRRAMRPFRRRMQIIFQDPYASLNPRLTVGRIIEEPLIVHRVGSKAERRARVAELMRAVGLPPEAVQRYPHEFSGGQRQRVGIARSLALDPSLVICDEPVSALDVSVQAQVVNLLMRLRAERGLSYLFISHDLAVVQHVSDRIIVMYLGKIAEIAPRRTIFQQPLHPYTSALLAALPGTDVTAPKRRRTVLEGDIPSPLAPPSGCRFRTRCSFAVARCSIQEPPLRVLADGRQIACHLVEEGANGSIKTPASQPDPSIVHLERFRSSGRSRAG
jgi:oligopeptide/dipeptide ABC transporter ATP-binding protein